MVEKLKEWCEGRLPKIVVVLLLIFLTVQAMLMGLNRTGGNDLDYFIKFSSLFFDGGNIASLPWGHTKTLLPVFVFAPLSLLPAYLYHAIWYLLSSILFIHSLITLRRAVGREFSWAAFMLVLVPFVELLQSNMLNGQLNIVAMALCLYGLQQMIAGNEKKAAIFFAASAAFFPQGVIIILFLLFSRRAALFINSFLLYLVFVYLLPSAFHAELVYDFYHGYLSGIVTQYEALPAYVMPAAFSVLLVTLILHKIFWQREDLATPIFLYLPLTVLCFYPFFNTHHLIWLLPGFLWITQDMAERQLLKQPLLYGYFFVVAVYLVARMQDEPRPAYMLFALSAWLLMAVSQRVLALRQH